ncbi:MAG: DoxX family protein [Pyrinomonadaceae bacterium]|nr:DoxX family protein [Pyrinomonadaceae bacterium]
MSSQFTDTVRAILTKIQPFLLWLLSTWFAYRMILNGFRKFDPEGMWTKAFEMWGYPVWFRLFIGILEVIGGVLILFPPARHIGGIILFVVMVGALATRITFGTGLDDALSIASFAVFFLYLTSLYKPKPTPQESA